MILITVVFCLSQFKNFRALQQQVLNLPKHYFLEGKQLDVTRSAPNASLWEGLSTENVVNKDNWKLNEINKSHLAEEFLKTPLDELVKEIKKLTPFVLGRVRIMRLAPHRCYSFHQDIDLRIQVPILSNRESLLLVNNKKAYNLQPDGSIFLFDARRPHTAINGSWDYDRINIVCSLIAENERDYDVFINKISSSKKEVAARPEWF